MKDDKLYLIHISECLQRVENYVDILGVDLEVVWQVVIKDLPDLKRSIIAMLRHAS